MFKAIQSLFKGIRNDGWTNVVTNLGTSNSRTNSTLFKPTLALDQYTLAEIYKSLCRKKKFPFAHDMLLECYRAASKLNDSASQYRGR